MLIYKIIWDSKRIRVAPIDKDNFPYSEENMEKILKCVA